MAQGENDREKIHLNLARLKKGNEKFEIDVDADKAIAFKLGAVSDIREVLKVQHVFADAKKGLLASDHVMQQVFKTSDPLEVANIIIKEGEIQLTEEYRRKIKEEKKKRTLGIIQRNGVDPKTNLPHPLTRLENAFEEAKVHLDDFKNAESQVEDVVKQLRHLLPIKFVMKEIAVKIPAQYATKSYGLVKGYGRIVREDWLTDGSWAVVIEMPGGIELEFYDKLNSFTHGNNETKILNVR